MDEEFKRGLNRIKNWPSVSFIVVAYNCKNNLKECLNRIAKQDYPKAKVELFVIDGGSTDGTIELAKKYTKRVIVAEQYKYEAEARRALGLLNAKNDIVIYIDSDNFILINDWLKQMIFPFLDNPKIIASETLRYSYVKEASILNRYFGLFGCADPVVYYLNRVDRLSWAFDKWNMSGDAEDCGSYYLVKFNKDTLSTVGCNGFAIRRKVLLKAKVNPPLLFFHTDVIYDLLELGYDALFAFVKTDIFHKSSDSIISFFRKRILYTMQLNCIGVQKRRWLVFDPKKIDHIINLIKFIFYTITFVKPLYDSIRGFIKKPDIAWFLHPFMCLFYLCMYAYITIRIALAKLGLCSYRIHPPE